MPVPTQIQPLIDPESPKGDERHVYFILTEMLSPPESAPPNAVNWVKFEEPKDLGGGDLAYGEITYTRLIDWAELKQYKMRPADKIHGLYFRLWEECGEDEDELMAWTTLFWKLTDNDGKELPRLRLALSLFNQGENRQKANKVIREMGK